MMMSTQKEISLKLLFSTYQSWNKKTPPFTYYDRWESKFEEWIAQKITHIAASHRNISSLRTAYEAGRINMGEFKIFSLNLLLQLNYFCGLNESEEHKTYLHFKLIIEVKPSFG